MSGSSAVIKVEYNKFWDEYQVKVFINGYYDHRMTYYTDDQQDAIITSRVMEVEMIPEYHDVFLTPKIKTVSGEEK